MILEQEVTFGGYEQYNPVIYPQPELEQLDFEFPGIDVHAVDDISIHYFKA